MAVYLHKNPFIDLTINSNTKPYNSVSSRLWVWAPFHCSHRGNFCNCEKKAWKKIRLVRETKPWPPRYRFSALTNMDDGTRQTLAKEKSFHTFHLQETEDQQPCEQPYGFHMEHPGNVFYAAVEQSWVHQGSQFPPLPNNRQRTFTSYIVEALLRVDIQCRVIVTCVCA